MKRLIAALILVILPALSWAHLPRSAPADVYPVQFTADWQGIGAIGAVPADLVIVMATSTYTRTLNNFIVGPSFTVTVTEPGPYDWRLKGWQHLATGGLGASSPIDAGTQLVGDSPEVVPWSEPPCPWDVCWRYEQGDNLIEVMDFSRLKRWFGAEQPCCPPLLMEFDAVDFDGSSTVDTSDFEFIRPPRFGQSGFEFQP